MRTRRGGVQLPEDDRVEMALAPSSGPGPARESAELGQAPGRRRRENTVLSEVHPLRSRPGRGHQPSGGRLKSWGGVHLLRPRPGRGHADMVGSSVGMVTSSEGCRVKSGGWAIIPSVARLILSNPNGKFDPISALRPPALAEFPPAPRAQGAWWRWRGVYSAFPPSKPMMATNPIFASSKQTSPV